MRNLFRTRIETAVFRLPGADTEMSCQVEFRQDPLTGRTSVICESLLKKVEILYGETDREVLKQLVDASREKCFFCAPAVFRNTPRYPESLCADGYMQGKQSILFPNLFPIAEIHAVLTWPDRHFLAPEEFATDRVEDLLLLVHTFGHEIQRKLSSIEFLSLNCNYMPPAGASVVHPHFQLIGTREPPYRLDKIIQAARAWISERGENYWDVLRRAEQEQGERWIGSRGRWHWVTAWSPLGANEILGIHESAATVFDLDESDWHHLASGLHRVLRCFGDKSYSSFNFCLAGGARSGPEGQRCVMRIISRQNVKSMYRNDEYFLQKFHGIELIVTAPETLSGDLKQCFDD